MLKLKNEIKAVLEYSVTVYSLKQISVKEAKFCLQPHNVTVSCNSSPCSKKHSWVGGLKRDSWATALDVFTTSLAETQECLSLGRGSPPEKSSLGCPGPEEELYTAAIPCQGRMRKRCDRALSPIKLSALSTHLLLWHIPGSNTQLCMHQLYRKWDSHMHTQSCPICT